MTQDGKLHGKDLVMKIRHMVLCMLIVICSCHVFAFAGQGLTGAHAADTMMSQYFKWVKMGKAAIPEIKAALASKEWREKTHALLAAGQIGDKSLIPEIMDILKSDPNRAVKNCAVKALGDLKADVAVPELIGMLASDTEKQASSGLDQRIVIEALGKIGDKRATLPLCRLLLSSRNENIRNRTADAIVAIHDKKASSFLLAQKKRNPDFPYVQAAAIISRIPIKGAEDFILKMLDSPKPTVKNAAADALLRVGTDKSIPKLLDAFPGPDLFLRKKIGEALVAIDSSAAVPQLCDLLKGHDKKLIMDAANVLSRMDADNIPGIVFERFEKDPGYNAGAAYVLGLKGYDPAIPVLRKRLKDPAQTGKNEMAEALGRLGDRDSIPLLISMAAKEMPDGAIGAIYALGDLKAKDAMPVLLSLLKKQNPKLTGPVIFALGQIGDPAAVRPLIDLYYGSGLKYQFQIGLALAQIGGVPVLQFIKDNMDSGNPKRRNMAGFILLKSKDKNFIPYALSLVDDPDKNIRSYAIGALKNMTGLSYDTAAEWKKWAFRHGYRG